MVILACTGIEEGISITSWALFLITFGILMGITGFILLEDYTFREAFYMTVITISTVGFSEVRPLSRNGQIFTTLLILFNVGIFAYSLSTFTSLVIEGELFKNIHLRTIQLHIAKMKNHIIVCGYGRYGREISENLLTHDIPFIVIDHDPKKIEEIQHSQEKILYLESDVTSEDALEKAHIQRARALITTLSDATDNLFTVMSARQLNPSINIISSTKDHRTEKKLRMVAANHVIRSAATIPASGFGLRSSFYPIPPLENKTLRTPRPLREESNPEVRSVQGSAKVRTMWHTFATNNASLALISLFHMTKCLV